MPLLTSITNTAICANQLPYIWYGNPISLPGTYIDTLSSTTGGCDTVATLNLVITPLITSTTNATVCANQLPYIWNGNPYNTAGTYIDTLSSTTGGCDTVATLNLVITPLITTITNANICANQLPYIWNGNPYNTAGTYIDTLPSTTGGCDTVTTLNLTITPLLTTITNAAVCANQLPYMWNGNPISLPGTYIDTLSSTTGGCDTVATLNLVITPLITTITNANICANQLPYIWNGNPYNTAGTYIDTLPSTTGGCDTVTTLNLTITPLLTTITNAAVCANQLPYMWNGNPYNIAGTYIDTLSSTTGGCDTVATLNLVITPLITTITNANICANQLPYIWNGNLYSTAGTYIDTLPSTTGGCDTIATLNFVINPLLTSTTNAAVCSNQLPFIWNGNPYNTAGTFIDTLPGTTGGCDTVATLNLIINPVTTSLTRDTVCSNQLPYLWNNNAYNSAGTYSVTLTNSRGCDSIATLNLVVKLVTTSLTRDTICANFLPYLWNGNSYPAAGTYTVTLQNSVGCDSLATLGLFVKPTPVLLINQPQAVCAPATIDLTRPSIIAGSEPGLILTFWLDSLATIPLPNPQAIAQSGTYYIRALGVNSCFSTRPVAVNVLVHSLIPGIRYPTLEAPIGTNLDIDARDFGVSYLWSPPRSEEHTSELQSHSDLVCRLLLEKKKKKKKKSQTIKNNVCHRSH